MILLLLSFERTFSCQEQSNSRRLLNDLIEIYSVNEIATLSYLAMATSREPPSITADLDGIICKICFSCFKEPKLLVCGHTFCLKCVQHMLDSSEKKTINCPFCRVSTNILHGKANNLQTNIMLKAVVQDAMNLEKNCDECNQVYKRDSLCYCFKCAVYLCSKCKSDHLEHFESESSTMVHTASTYAPSLKNLIKKCNQHHGESYTKVCISCGVQFCDKCEELHRKKKHEVKGIMGFVNEIRASASSLQTLVTNFEGECKESHKFVVLNGKEANAFLNNIESEIKDNRRQLIEQVDERTNVLLQSLETLRKKIKNAEDEMAAVGRESVNLMSEVKLSADTILQHPLDNISSHEHRLKQLQEEITKMHIKKNSKREMSINTVDSVHKVHFEKSSLDDLQIGFLTMHNWNRKDMPLKTSSMACAALRLDGKITIGYGDGGVSLVSENGSENIILEGVKALAIAYLKRGDLVVRNTDNVISIYNQKNKKTSTNFTTLGKEGGGGDLTVNTRDEILVSYTNKKQIDLYNASGGQAMRSIKCGDRIPQQIVSTRRFGIIIADASIIVKVIERVGKHIPGIQHNGFFGYPTVSSDGSLLVAWVNQHENNVRVEQFTKELKTSSLVLTDYSLPETERNWHRLLYQSSDKIALVSAKTIHQYSRQKSTFS